MKNRKGETEKNKKRTNRDGIEWKARKKRQQRKKDKKKVKTETNELRIIEMNKRQTSREISQEWKEKNGAKPRRTKGREDEEHE